MLYRKVHWQLTIGKDTPETSLVFMNLFYGKKNDYSWNQSSIYEFVLWKKNMIKFKTVVLCLKLLTYLIVQRSFGNTEFNGDVYLYCFD